MKKGLSALVAGMLSISVIAGCSGKSEEKVSGTPDSAAASTTAASASAVPAAPKKVTLSMLTESHPSWPYAKDTLAWKIIEEKTGVHFDVQVPSGKLEDTINLNVASGNLPDVTYFLELSMANKIGQQGALINILDYKDQMPNFKKWMEKYPDVVKSFLAADGKMYMLPNEGIGETNRMVWLYRKDVFEENGLKVPANFDELHDVLKKLKEKYPNTYPLTFRFGAKLNILRNIAPSFQTSETFYKAENGEVKYGPIDDNYKNMIKYLNTFYKEGLIPPDWLTIETKQWQDMMSTNKSFLTIDYIGRVDFFNNALRKENPKFNLAFMAPPAGFAGGKGNNAYTQYQVAGMTISSKSKNIKDAVRMMDWLYTEEAKTLMSWGKEGETYTVEGGKKKIKPEFTDVAGLRKATNLSTNGTYTWFDFDAHLSLSTKDLQEAYTQARNYNGVLRLPPSFTEQEQEKVSTKGDQIDKNREETISKMILGNKSLDEWNAYVDGVKKLGLQELLDVYKVAFDRQSKISLK